MIDFICVLFFLISPFVGLFWLSMRISKIIDFIEKEKEK